MWRDDKKSATTYYGKSAAEASGRPEGTAMSVTFELEGQLFMALNGGPVALRMVERRVWRVMADRS